MRRVGTGAGCNSAHHSLQDPMTATSLTPLCTSDEGSLPSPHNSQHKGAATVAAVAAASKGSG